MSPRRNSPDHGRLLSFDIQPNGGVLAYVSDIEDDYAHPVLITYSELQGLAEASRVRCECVSEAADRQETALKTYLGLHGEAENRHKH